MPSISNTPRPAYVYDAANNQWVPVGFGPHTHSISDVTNAVSALGGSVISNAVGSVRPLVVKGAPSQTASLQEWHNSSGTALVVIDSNGNMGIGGAGTPNSKLTVSGSSRVRWDVTTSAVQEISTNTAENAYRDKESDAASHTFKVNGTEKLRINSAGLTTFGTTGYATLNPGNYAYDFVNPGNWLKGSITTSGSYGGPISMLDGAAGFNFRLQDSGGTLRIGSGTTTSGLTDIAIFTSGGNFGVGTSGPSYKVDIQDSTTNNWYGLRLLSAAPSVQAYSGISLEKGSGYGGIVAGYLHQGNGSGLQILTNNGGSVVEVARAISNGSSFLIGYTTTNSTSYRLQVNSQIFSTSSTIATSDARYKENVINLEGGLAAIKALRPVEFNWKDQEDVIVDDKVVREAHSFPKGKTVGFIAQEVQEAFADKPWINNLVKENSRDAVFDSEGNELVPKEDFLGIAEGNLVAILVSAVKELTAKVEELEAKLK